MYKKILVANRGEIACRVFRSAKKMGIATVAVYSDADRQALHVQHADEAVYIGAAPSSESYLNIARIVQACIDTGADAVHPGYGFLSENAAFCAALEAAGITFIGPGVRAIEAMGDKITSKLIAEEAKINTIPGYTGEVRDADHALEISEGIGFPVMLKASAGGGGKGMRVARNAEEVREGFERASSEAQNSFGDARLFIEKFVESPRHIEIQLIADTHHNVLYLGERECSIQRRHQKVIEEAPSSFVTPELRRAMGEQAVMLAEAVEYCSAGTVEFIVDSERNFYFLEMNTRLQVEHPVTELVTGLDLVELMINVAAGKPLVMSQEDITLTGWAMESRIYAEDSQRGFVPSTGRVLRYIEPSGEGVRVDAGVAEGGEVSMYYDPMISKLVTYGADRSQAIERMVEALDAYMIRGLHTNIEFLSDLMRHRDVANGDINTHFIEQHYPDGFSGTASDDIALLAAVAAMAEHRLQARMGTPSEALSVSLAGEHFDIAFHPLRINGVVRDWESHWRPGQYHFWLEAPRRCFTIERDGLAWVIGEHGTQHVIRVLTPREAALSVHMIDKTPPDLSQFLLSPMPGLLTKLSVSVGQSVSAGDELAIVEAMKMENRLSATQDGVVKAVCAQVGESLRVDQAIIEFD